MKTLVFFLNDTQDKQRQHIHKAMSCPFMKETPSFIF